MQYLFSSCCELVLSSCCDNYLLFYVSKYTYLNYVMSICCYEISFVLDYVIILIFSVCKYTHYVIMILKLY